MAKPKDFLKMGMGGDEFHKGAKNGLISIVGGALGWIVFTKLGLEISVEYVQAIEYISALVGAILFNYINYYVNFWRV